MSGRSAGVPGIRFKSWSDSSAQDFAMDLDMRHVPYEKDGDVFIVGHDDGWVRELAQDLGMERLEAYES